MPEYKLWIEIDLATLTLRSIATINSNGVYRLSGNTIVREDTLTTKDVPFLEAKTCFLNQFLKTNKIKAV